MCTYIHIYIYFNQHMSCVNPFICLHELSFELFHIIWYARIFFQFETFKKLCDREKLTYRKFRAPDSSSLKYPDLQFPSYYSYPDVKNENGGFKTNRWNQLSCKNPLPLILTFRFEYFIIDGFPAPAELSAEGRQAPRKAHIFH